MILLLSIITMHLFVVNQALFFGIGGGGGGGCACSPPPACAPVQACPQFGSKTSIIKILIKNFLLKPLIVFLNYVEEVIPILVLLIFIQNKTHTRYDKTCSKISKNLILNIKIFF